MSNPTPTQANQLATPLRWLSGAASLGGLGSGGVAVFETDNEIGSSALLAVGLFFAVVGLLGRIPRIKLGDNEFDPGVAYAAGARDGADRVTDAVTEAALETDDPKKIVEVARNAEARLMRQLNGRRIRLERIVDTEGVKRVRVTAQNGQVIGFLDDVPGLWQEQGSPQPDRSAAPRAD